MKATLNVTKSYTISILKWESIKPSLSLTIHDVPLDKVREVHENLDNIADVLIHDQILSDARIIGNIKKLGLKEYFKKINKDKMIKTMNDSIDNIMKITKEDI